MRALPPNGERRVARDLFMTAPSFDVSLEQIAEQVGVALETVQRRFGSKDALLVECAAGEREERQVRARLGTAGAGAWACPESCVNARWPKCSRLRFARWQAAGPQPKEAPHA
jgi:AcrR family transcriptional regulator